MTPGEQFIAASLEDPCQPKPNEGALRRELNALKRTEFPWLMAVTKCAQEAIRALGVAYKNWFQSLSGKRKGPKVGAPSFKRKGQRDSFKIHGNLIAVDDCRIHIPRRPRPVRLVVIGCWRYRSRSGTGPVRCVKRNMTATRTRLGTFWPRV